MVKYLKDYFIEQGMPNDLALALDEIGSAIHNRVRRFNKKGVTKNLIMVDMGKYRHMETRSPNNLPEMNRVTLDAMLLILNFSDRIRILEHYNILKLNFLTAEYEFTEFGKQFFEHPPV